MRSGRIPAASRRREIPRSADTRVTGAERGTSRRELQNGNHVGEAKSVRKMNAEAPIRPRAGRRGGMGTLAEACRTGDETLSDVHAFRNDETWFEHALPRFRATPGACRRARTFEVGFFTTETRSHGDREGCAGAFRTSRVKGSAPRPGRPRRLTCSDTAHLVRVGGGR